MNITSRSTSPLMMKLFGKNLDIVLDEYNSTIIEIAESNRFIDDIFSEFVNRTGFLFPYMSSQYAYHSVKNSFIPQTFQKQLIGFGLIGLAVSIDDDVADEYNDDLVRMTKNLSASQLIQNKAYELIFSDINFIEKSRGTMKIISETLSEVAVYQTRDAINIKQFPVEGFDMDDYAKATFKTVCPIKYGFRLGLEFGNVNDSELIDAYDRVAECLGVALQLIDDVMDIESDIKSYKSPVTLPIYYIKRYGTMEKVHTLIEMLLKEASNTIYKFAYTEMLENLIRGFFVINEKIKRERNLLFA